MLLASLLLTIALAHGAHCDAARQGYGNAAETPQESAKRKPFEVGVINHKAVKFPQPKYPVEARAAGVSGEVRVRVTISVDDGKVVEAEAIAGPELLRAAAVGAARRAEFSPTRYTGPPIFARGTLVYKFRPRRRR